MDVLRMVGWPSRCSQHARICCEIPVDKLPQSFETNAPFLGAGRGEGWICKRRAKKENLMQSELTELLVKSLYEVAWNLLRQLKENQEIHIRQKLALLSICLKMLHNITSYANFLQITLKSPWSRFPCLKGFHKWAFSSLKSFSLYPHTDRPSRIVARWR